MSELKVSISGIRGIWGDSLTLDSLKSYTTAFGRYILSEGGKSLLMGRDARPTGFMIGQYVSSILNAMGLDIIDCGIVPTPTVLFGVRKLKLDGGMIITASHNPVEWNALKFVKKGGVFTGERDLEKILGFMGQPIQEAPYNKIGKLTPDEFVADLHIQEILKNIDLSAIHRKKYSVVLDPVNSAGSAISQKLLAEMNCKVTVVNGDMNGSFERGTEPTPHNLKHLHSVIPEHAADIGFAQDPDADRLVLIDEQGHVLSEELTLALVIDSLLSRRKGDIVVNMSTSMIHEALAKKYGVNCHRTKVGEANVVEGIQTHKALIGGEGNGGVIYPTINTARDSLVGIALILESMALRGKRLSDLVDELPKYTMAKEKFEFKGDLSSLLTHIKSSFQSAAATEMDGLRLDWLEQGKPVWIHIRASNTEPVIRIIGEAEDPISLEKAIDTIRHQVNYGRVL